MLRRTSINFVNNTLNKNSNWKILDIGCGYTANKRATVIADIKNLSDFYKNKNFVKITDKKLPFKDNEFDFVMAFACVYILNLKGVMDCLREIQRVGKGKSYITVGAYNTEEEKDLFLEWTLLGTTVLHVDEWLEVFEAVGYTGDYYFTTASSLNLVRES